MRKGKISLGWKVVIVIFLILLVDQIVKVWIKASFTPYDNIQEVIPGFFNLHYIENPGMAFGTTLGDGVLAKYALSIFRLVAIIGIGYYIWKLLKEKNVHTGLIYAVGFIFAGATGNLIDGMLYDYIWELDCTIPWNQRVEELEDGGKIIACRKEGFLLGSVVDMFRFTVKWPEGTPFGLGGKEIFGAIWNVADASITIGVAIIIIRYKAFFRKSKEGEDGQDDQAPVTSSVSAQEAE